MRSELEFSLLRNVLLIGNRITMRLVIISLLFSLLAVFGEPTEERVWTSSAGTKVKAKALSFEGEHVTLRTHEGRELKLTLEQFSDSDQAVLRKHFSIDTTKGDEALKRESEFLSEGLAHPQGEAVGPIAAGEESNYFLYIPKSLRKGRKAPLLFYTSAGGGGKHTVKHFREAAELNGWVIAASKESRNGKGHPVRTHNHSKQCLKHLLETLPIDEERVYFSGNSGGGAMSFYNALRIKSMGNMPIVGYSPDKKYTRGQYCIGVGGARDFNRYLTAIAVKEFKNKGFHRMSPGGHTGGAPWIQNECVVWLNGRYLGDRRKEKSLNAERLDFESALINWLETLKQKFPYRAHYWCHFLTEEYEITGQNAVLVQTLMKELAKDEINVRYTQGVYAIDAFSEKIYAPYGRSGGSKRNHADGKIEKAANKLLEEFKGIPVIEEIAQDLGLPTA